MVKNNYTNSINVFKNVYFLLGGGCTTGLSCRKLSNEILSQTLLKELKVCNILFVNFGKERQFWEKSVKKYTETLLVDILKIKKTKILMADFESVLLVEQFKIANIIFFTGGSELLFKKYIRKSLIPSNNKIIIGNSAGVNIFSKAYFSNDRNNIEKGLGILPINTFCHYSSQKEFSLKFLSQKNKFPTLSIGHDDYIKIIY